MQRVQLLAALHRLFLLSQRTDDSCHAGHRLAKILTGVLDFLALALQLVNDGMLALPYLSDFLDTIAPEGQHNDSDDDIYRQGPP